MISCSKFAVESREVGTKGISMKRGRLVISLLLTIIIVLTGIIIGLHPAPSVMAQTLAAHQCPGSPVCWQGNYLNLNELGQPPQANPFSDLQPYCNSRLSSPAWTVCTYGWQIRDRSGTAHGHANIVTVEVTREAVHTGDLMAVYGFPVGLNPCWGPVLLPFSEIDRLKRGYNTDNLPVVLHFRNNVSATIWSYWTYGEKLQLASTDPVRAIHYSDNILYYAEDVDFLPWRGYTLYHHHCSP